MEQTNDLVILHRSQGAILMLRRLRQLRDSVNANGKTQKGTTMQEQMNMAFMQEGGMQDDGGETEPKSGNKVPSGSLKEEVADDIPTMLSEGEFVFPADVVRYIGLETLMKMRQDAKQGLKMMEKMGQLGNPEEAEIPDDIPFGMADLVVISGEMKKEDDEKEEKAEGGVVGLQTGGLLDDPRFTSQVTAGTQPTEYTEEEKQEIRDSLKTAPTRGTVTLKKIVNPNNPDDFEMHPFEGDEPMFPLPEGYVVDDTPMEQQIDPRAASSGSTPTQEGSDRQFADPTDGAGTLSMPEAPMSTEIFAREDDKPYALYNEQGNPIKLQKSAYENLKREYEKLGGDNVFATDGKNGFANYYNMPFLEKVALNVGYDLQQVSGLGTAYSDDEIKGLLNKYKEGEIKLGNPLYGIITKAFRSITNAATSGLARDMAKLKKDMSESERRRFEAQEQAKKAREDAQKEIDRITAATPIQGEDRGVTQQRREETKVGAEDLSKFEEALQTKAQSKMPMTSMDRMLLYGSTDPKNITQAQLGRMEKNVQDVRSKAEQDARDRAGFGRTGTEPKKDLIQRAEESVGQGDLDTVAQNVAFDKQMEEAQRVARGFYVGGVPTKPMKPQRLKKGGIASPKAKPKRMKKGGLASSRKK